MKHFAALLLLCLPVWLLAQQKPSLPHITPDAPNWMHMLAEENPNVYQVQKAYAAYYDEHPFVKNAYTQYFKHWPIYEINSNFNIGYFFSIVMRNW